VEKERSAVAVVTGKVTSTCSRMDGFEYRDALHAVYASSAVWVVPLQHASFAFAGYKNAVQSIGYAAAYPAYPLNPPLPARHSHTKPPTNYEVSSSSSF